MTQQEIIEGNKLIAQFLNWQLDLIGKWAKPAVGDGFNAPDGGYKSGDRREDKELEFHENWQWLIPVVEKIKSIPVNDGTELIRRIDKVVHSLYQIKIGVTYLLCVEFLQWYNSLSK